MEDIPYLNLEDSSLTTPIPTPIPGSSSSNPASVSPSFSSTSGSSSPGPPPNERPVAQLPGRRKPEHMATNRGRESAEVFGQTYNADICGQ